MENGKRRKLFPTSMAKTFSDCYEKEDEVTGKGRGNIRNRRGLMGKG